MPNHDYPKRMVTATKPPPPRATYKDILNYVTNLPTGAVQMHAGSIAGTLDECIDLIDRLLQNLPDRSDGVIRTIAVQHAADALDPVVWHAVDFRPTSPDNNHAYALRRLRHYLERPRFALHREWGVRVYDSIDVNANQEASDE